MALGVLAGSWMSAWIDQHSFTYALVAGTGASIGALLGGRIHQFVRTQAQYLGSFVHPAALVLAALLSAACSGLAGSGGMFLIGRLATRELLPGFTGGWIADTVGCLVLAPLVLSLGAGRSFRGGSFSAQALRLGLVLAFFAAVLLLLYFWSEGKSWIMFVFPVLLPALVVAGEGGLFASVWFVTLFFVTANRMGYLPFAGSYLQGSMTGFQVYVTGTALVALVLSGMSRVRLTRLPVMILLLGWSLSAWIYCAISDSARELAEARLGRLAQRVESDFDSQIQTYVDALRGGAGLITAQPDISVNDWHEYNLALDISGRNSAIWGLAVIFPTRAEQEAGLVARLQAQSGRPFVIHDVPGASPDFLPPDAAGPARFIVGMIEPVDPNLPALGLDLASEAKRRVAAIKSRDSGRAVMTKRIQLVQDNVERAGFLLYLPVYQGGVTPSTVADRRSHHLAWVNAPIGIEQFVHEAFTDHGEDLALYFFEGSTVAAPEKLWIATAPGPIPTRFDRVQTIELAGEPFTLGWRWVASQRDRERGSAVFIATSVSLIWTLLAGLVVSLQSFATRARAEADERTRELRSVNSELAANNLKLSATEIWLRESQVELKKLAHVAAQTDNGVMITDADGRIEWTNDSFFRLTGYSRLEAKGRKPGELLQGPGTCPAAIAEFRAKIKSELGFRLELLNYRKDRSEILISIEVQPLFDAEGRLANYLGIQRDITSERLAKDELERSRKESEAASRAKSSFLANVSHELRTPLNVIIGSAEMVLRGRHGPVAEAQLRPLQRVRESAGLLLSLINELLDLTRAESGRVQLEPGPVEIASLAREIVKLLEPEANERGLTLRLELGHRTPVIEADPRRLKQILLNLLSNAVKYTPAGGRIDFLIGETNHPAEITFALRDTGPGIPAGDQERVFLEFERVETQDLRTGGSGLGLPIARRLTELHGGTLTLQSTLGQGSVFLVRLPRRISETVAVSPVPQRSAPPVPISTGGRLVLVAEDYPANLELITSYLEAEGFRVATATNGREAVDRAIALQPAIVLMDLKMPVLDGLGAIRLLRQDERTRWLPIIALTAFAYESDRNKAQDAGADEYVSKPIDFGLLQRAIQNCLDSDR